MFCVRFFNKSRGFENHSSLSWKYRFKYLFETKCDFREYDVRHKISFLYILPRSHNSFWVNSGFKKKQTKFIFTINRLQE